MGSDEEGQILDDDPQQSKEEGDGTIVGVPVTLAANSGTSVALPGRGAGCCGPFGSCIMRC